MDSKPNLLSYDELITKLKCPEGDLEITTADSRQFLRNDLSNKTIALTSYPRSGNTLVRTFIEKLTGVFTGSDCDRRRNLNK